MVKYRRRQFRRRGRKTPWYAKKYSAMQLAGKALSATRYIRGLVNSEMFHYQKTGNSNLFSSGTILPITDIAIGDTAVTRTGNSIFARSLFLNLLIKSNASNLNTQFCRVILFTDTQQVADTTPAVTDVLTTATPNSTLNANNAGRFKIIKNWQFYINQSTKPAFQIKKYTKLWHHVKYNGSASTDIQRGGLYLLYLSDQGSYTPDIAYQTNLGYHDN